MIVPQNSHPFSFFLFSSLFPLAIATRLEVIAGLECSSLSLFPPLPFFLVTLLVFLFELGNGLFTSSKATVNSIWSLHSFGSWAEMNLLCLPSMALLDAGLPLSLFVSVLWLEWGPLGFGIRCTVPRRYGRDDPDAKTFSFAPVDSPAVPGLHGSLVAYCSY